MVCFNRSRKNSTMLFLVHSVISLSTLLSTWAIADPAALVRGEGWHNVGVVSVRCEVVSGQDRAGQATIEIRSVPSGASVYLDRNPKGQTPVTITGVSLGPHSLELKMKGYPDFPTTIQVAEKNEPFTFRMIKPAVLKVNSRVPQVEVWIEDQNYGNTPLYQQLQPGQYTVLLRKNPYPDSLVVVNLLEGQDLDLQVDLKPLPVTLEIDLEPPAATVLVDSTGLQVQNGKASMSIRPGKHTLRVFLDGYESQNLDLNIEPGKSQRIQVRLAVKTSSNLIYYLAGGGAAIVGGYLIYKKLIEPTEVLPPKDGRPPNFPDPNR